MAPSKTRTMKNKNAAPSAAAKRAEKDGVTKPRTSSKGAKKGPAVSQQLKEKNRALLLKKPKKKNYTEEQLGIPKLNMITPVGVTKPKGKKKGKVFVDDKEGMTTIMAMVQAEKEGQIESKMIKARQMEEIREARKVEAEKKEAEKAARLEDVKDSLRKKRKRKSTGDVEDSIQRESSTGTRAGKPKSKRVSFA